MGRGFWGFLRCGLLEGFVGARERWGWVGGHSRRRGQSSISCRVNSFRFRIGLCPTLSRSRSQKSPTIHPGPNSWPGLSSPSSLPTPPLAPVSHQPLSLLLIPPPAVPPSPELVKRVRDLYHKRLPDVRFLIPVLNGLEKVRSCTPGCPHPRGHAWQGREEGGTRAPSSDAASTAWVLSGSVSTRQAPPLSEPQLLPLVSEYPSDPPRPNPPYTQSGATEAGQGRLRLCVCFRCPSLVPPRLWDLG